MSRARGALCRACLALAAALAALLLLPLPRVPAPAPAPAPTPTPGPGPRGPPGRAAAPRLRPEDVFIAVKTTRKNHGPRLGLLLRTWISRARRQVGPAQDPAPETPPRQPQPGDPQPDTTTPGNPTLAAVLPDHGTLLSRAVSLALWPGPKPRVREDAGPPRAHLLLPFSRVQTWVGSPS